MATGNQVTPGFDRYEKMKPQFGDNIPDGLSKLLEQAEAKGYALGYLDGKADGFKQGVQWMSGK
jgi:hypothetical protein